MASALVCLLPNRKNGHTFNSNDNRRPLHLFQDFRQNRAGHVAAHLPHVEGVGIDGRPRFAGDVLEKEFDGGLVAGLGVVAQLDGDVLDVLFADGFHQGGAEGGALAGERIAGAELVAGANLPSAARPEGDGVASAVVGCSDMGMLR